MSMLADISGLLLGLSLMAMALSVPTHIKWAGWVYVVGILLVILSGMSMAGGYLIETNQPPIPSKMCFEGTTYLLLDDERMTVQFVDGKTVDCQ